MCEAYPAIAAAREVALTEFDRPIYMLMGLPVDAVTTAQATELVRNAALNGNKCFLSTPNLNFAITAGRDSAFRDSVIDSDLVLADGMPLIWTAKLLGIPVPERVAGSSVAANLQHDRPANRQIRVYFFGGQPGVAEQACRKLADQQGGLIGVGYHNPGFGSVEEMSSESILADINAAKPDLVLVSLGAKKGQAWIQANRHKIYAPVISHLGAVVNFIAGTVARAPNWMQRTGLEWVWRMLEEHALIKRYWQDGLAFLMELRLHILPLRRAIKVWHGRLPSLPPLRVVLDEQGETGLRLKVTGRACGTELSQARQIFKVVAAKTPARIEVELKDCVYVDGAFLGLLCLLLKHQRAAGQELVLTGVTDQLKQLFGLYGAAYLLLPALSREKSA